MIFSDVSAAFESVIRSLVFEERISDESITMLFHQLGFSPAVFDEFRDTLTSPNAFAMAGVPQSLVDIVKSVHDASWFSINGLSELSVSNHGG